MINSVYQGEESLSVYLEYVSGGSIHKLLQEYGAFKEPVIRNYTRKILSGLAYLHGRNTVHRYLAVNNAHGSYFHVCGSLCKIKGTFSFTFGHKWNIPLMAGTSKGQTS